MSRGGDIAKKKPISVITRFLLLLTTFIMTLSSHGQNSKETDFAKKVIEAFKSKSFDKFKLLLPTKADFEELHSDKSVVRGLLINTDDKYNKVLESYDKGIDSAYKSKFNRLLTKGDKLNIDWTQILFLKFTPKKDKPKNSDMTFLSGRIHFKYQGSVYILSALEALEINGDYKLSMIGNVQQGKDER